jgi:oligopeptide/dipeptide ABC transporter ATP-binding protein
VKRFLIKGVKKYFERGGFFSGGRPHLVLNIEDMSIEEDQSVGLIGESGSGKTTIARLLMRIIRPDRGRIEYFGRDLNSLEGEELKRYRRDCQMIFQDPSSQFNPRMTIEEILREPLLINGVLRQNEHRIKEILHLVSLPEDITKRYIHQISGGQRQRISIARALILNPSFIICDEPVSALDISVSTQILNLLFDLKQKMGIHYLFISHDLSVVRYLCDYVYILYSGRIVEKGRIQEIFESPYHPYTKELLRAASLNIDEVSLTGDEGEMSSGDIEGNSCLFSRCENYSECLEKPLFEKRLTETHSVFCNL